MRPGFLGSTDYWFSGYYGDIYQTPIPRDLTAIPWYQQFSVERPFYEKYWDQSEWAAAAKRATGNK